MQVAPSSPVSNRLIGRLPRKERTQLLALCETTTLEFGAILCEEGQRVQHVYFPLTGFVSLLASVQGHPPLEMGLIGNEGMLGATLVLGVDVVPLRGIVQGPGTALRLTVMQFKRVIADCPCLLRTLNRYLYVLLAQLSQIAACSRFHLIEPRLVRWLLMTHDRAHADHFHLTHQWLADMLGVQRSAITLAAGALQARKLIQYSRGDIRILDRNRLEAASCACYGLVVDDYAQRLG
jgi:CRP-like cAMP-binding protein